MEPAVRLVVAKQSEVIARLAPGSLRGEGVATCGSLMFLKPLEAMGACLLTCLGGF